MVTGGAIAFLSDNPFIAAVALALGGLAVLFRHQRPGAGAVPSTPMSWADWSAFAIIVTACVYAVLLQFPAAAAIAFAVGALTVLMRRERRELAALSRLGARRLGWGRLIVGVASAFLVVLLVGFVWLLMHFQGPGREKPLDSLPPQVPVGFRIYPDARPATLTVVNSGQPDEWDIVRFTVAGEPSEVVAWQAGERSVASTALNPLSKLRLESRERPGR